MIKRQSMEILRKLAACAFAFALVTSLVPVAAFANPAEPQVQPAEEVTDPADPTPGPIAEGEIGNCTWTIDGQTGTLVIAPGENGGSLEDVWSPTWDGHAADIKIVRFERGVSSGQILHGLFANCTSLAYVGGMRNFDTANANNMSSMFEGCSSLVYIDVTDLDTSKVTRMDSMFKGCSMLQEVEFSGVSTAAVENMQSMFEGCSSLSELDLTGINTQSVTNAQSMFDGCEKLESLDLSGFDMTSVTAVKDMFAGCGSLVTLKLPALGMKDVTDMSGVFSGCAALESLDLTNIATASATTMARMFEDCAALTTLDLSSFNTANVTDMGNMFAGCAALKTLNLSSFNTTNVTSMNSLFGDCEALVDVTLGDKFSFESETSWLPAGVWEASPGDARYTSQEIAGLTISTETVFTRKMVLTDVQSNDREFTYDGTAKIPTVIVASGDRTLTEGTDYAVVAPDDGLSVGSKTLIVKGVGSYSGEKTIDYEITPAPITDLTLDADELTYDGTEQVPALTVKAGELVLDPETDFDVATSDDIINVGTKTVKITAKGNFEGTLEMDYEIVAAGVTAIELSADKFTYDGTDKTPAITVKAGDTTLVAGTDYELTLPTDRVTVGTKTVKAIAKGNYAGEVEASYEIAPAAISKVELSATKFTYDGKDKTPTVTVKCGDKTLTAGTDYDVTLPSDRVKVGKKTIKVTGKGNYTGTLEANYEIVEAPKPDTPDTPDNPDNPDNPDTPDTPDTPDNPDKPAQVEFTAMYRLYNPNSGEHFFTASTVERQHLISVGWNDEGQGWTAPKTGDAVYRLYNPNAGEHHYTLSTVERDSLIAAGWNDEGIGWYSDPNHAVPLYRVYNPNEFANNHHYTTNDFERGYLVALGWFGEGIAWYGIG